VTAREPHFFIVNRLLAAQLFLVRAGRGETRPLDRHTQ
jgi:hypothetical protein